jgi:mono/diheme cytochrome c family protein
MIDVQRWFKWIVCAAAIAPYAVAQQEIFTAEQLQAGRAIYTRVCSGCHGAELEGSGDAPALAGSTFLL